MTPKKILIFGATGPLGSLFVEKALQNKHLLTLYVRSPSKLSEELSSNSNVKVIYPMVNGEHHMLTILKDSQRGVER